MPRVAPPVKGRFAPLPPVKPAASPPWVLRAASRAVALPDEAQARQGEQVVDLVDAVAEWRYRRCQAAGGDRGGLRAQFLADPADDSVDLTGKAVDDSRAQRRLRAAADRGGR